MGQNIENGIHKKKDFFYFWARGEILRVGRSMHWGPRPPWIIFTVHFFAFWEKNIGKDARGISKSRGGAQPLIKNIFFSKKLHVKVELILAYSSKVCKKNVRKSIKRFVYNRWIGGWSKSKNEYFFYLYITQAFFCPLKQNFNTTRSGDV